MNPIRERFSSVVELDFHLSNSRINEDPAGDG